jgi:hypothetical protein
MLTCHVTYPDGETSEARYRATVEDMLAVIAPVDFLADASARDATTLVDVPAYAEEFAK